MAPLTNRPGAAVLYGGTEKMFPQLIYVSLLLYYSLVEATLDV